MSEQINNELIERARNANLAEYFLKSGYDCEMRRNELHVKGYGGLFVNTQTNQWFCFDGNGRGGNNAINCLTDVIGIDFKSAVEQLADGRFSYERTNNRADFQPAKRELSLPEKADNMKRVFAYLCQSRKIKPEIVSRLAHDGLLYQDQKGNAVFVHKDENGKIIGAEIQGTSSFQRYKGVAAGTSESVFSVKIGEPKKCYIFESAIDLMSFKQLANPDKIQNSLLVSMAGLKPNSLKKIAESGMKMFSCVDNDEAGIKFAKDNNFTPCRRILEENGVKDWNDLLKKTVEKIEKTEQKIPQNNARENEKNEQNFKKNAAHSHR